MNTDERARVKNRLDLALEAATRALERVNAEYDRLCVVHKDVAAPSPDGLLALRQANKLKDAALKTYHDAVKEYADFMVRGIDSEK